MTTLPETLWYVSEYGTVSPGVEVVEIHPTHETGALRWWHNGRGGAAWAEKSSCYATEQEAREEAVRRAWERVEEADAARDAASKALLEASIALARCRQGAMVAGG